MNEVVKTTEITTPSTKKFQTKKYKFSKLKTKKNFIHPTTSYIQLLQKKYPDINKLKYEFDIPYTSNKSQTNYNCTYGEITIDGIELLYKNIMSSFFDNYVFFDMGSGFGKIPIFMSSKQQIVKSIGIELLQHRYEFAISLFEKLQKKIFMQFIEKTSFYNEDFFNIDFQELSYCRDVQNHNKHSFIQYKSLIWISNLCFDTKVTTQIFKKLSKELLPGSIVCCSKCPPYDLNTLKLENCNFKFIKKINIPMTWNNLEEIFILYKEEGKEEGEEESEEEGEEESEEESEEEGEQTGEQKG